MASQTEDASFSEYLAPSIKPNNEFSSKFAILDVFAFIPVPVFAPGKSSSKRSICFSFILFFAMLGYILTTLHTFLYNNVPRTSQKQESIDNKSFKMPNIAITVIPDMDYGISVVNQQFYSIRMSQGILYEGLSKERKEDPISVNYECNPSWMPKMNFTSFICPTQLGNLEGNLFTSNQFQFIKIDFLTCVDGATPGVVCKSKKEIEEFLVKARIFLFIEQDADFYKTAVNAFKALFYYAVPTLYQKYEVYLENKEMATEPDYFYSFTTQKRSALFYGKEKTYASALVPGQENNLITIWLRLNEEEDQQKLQPMNLTEVLGKWGALWSVLFTTFGLYFMTWNKNKFYKRNPEWENFGSFINESPREAISSKVQLELETR